ncbi:hypothetical protein Y032_0030g2195 [Ancylostoma ceylanicum]|nr:hypothetical protein Y032_0030g2195 [Ancylostoma ceylanicum]
MAFGPMLVSHATMNAVLIPWLAPHQLNGNVEYPPSLQNILRSWRQKFPWVLPSKAALSREWNNLDAN